jgi:hypothetical protein
VTTDSGRDRRSDEHVEELADEAKDENPDPTTARETFELELMEEGRSEEGESVELADDAGDRPS